MKVHTIGIQLTENVYVPFVKSHILNRAFQIGQYRCELVGDCEGFDSEYQYRYILYVYEGRERAIPCFAVSSSTNSFIQKMKDAGQAIPGSYTLGVYPCDGKTRHINLGLSDEWADSEKFMARALALVQEHFKLTEAPAEIILSDRERQRVTLSNSREQPQPTPSQKKKGWWEFWK